MVFILGNIAHTTWLVRDDIPMKSHSVTLIMFGWEECSMISVKVNTMNGAALAQVCRYQTNTEKDIIF
jgi:hypothetical protein